MQWQCVFGRKLYISIWNRPSSSRLFWSHSCMKFEKISKTKLIWETTNERLRSITEMCKTLEQLILIMGIIDNEDIIHMTTNRSLNTTEKTSKTSKSPKKLSKPTEIFAPKIKFVEQPQISNINTLKTTKKNFDLSHTSHGRPGRICNM